MGVLLAIVLAQSEPVVVWLARHQHADGSWGARAGDCGCFGIVKVEAKAASRDAAVEERARPLIDDLASDDPERRERASAELRAMGESIEPALVEAEKSRDAEVRIRVAELLKALRAPRGKGDTEATALALLSMFGQGHSHLSRDAYGDIVMGKVVKEGLKWLLAQQTEDGRIGHETGVRPAVVAALALSEAYGMTCSQILKEPAQKAIDWVVSRQRKSGAWGDDADDVEATCWAILALWSANPSELTYERDRSIAAFAWAKERADASTLNRAAFVIAAAVERRKDARDHAAKLAELKPGELDPLARYMVSMAVRSAADDPSWRTFSSALKESLTASPGGDGCGTAGVGRAVALRLQTLQLLYGRRPSVFMSGK